MEDRTDRDTYAFLSQQGLLEENGDSKEIAVMKYFNEPEPLPTVRRITDARVRLARRCRGITDDARDEEEIC
jgi:hypothetical protein